MKCLYVIANYLDGRQKFFEEHYLPRMEKFAQLHEYDILLSSGGELFRGNPTWWKFTKLGELLDQYDEVLHLDADMRIDKFDNDYPCNKSFTIAVDNGNTFCMGSFKIKNNEWSRKLVKDILREDIWETNKDKEFFRNFREQAVFYHLCGIPSHSWIPFPSLSDFGWNSFDCEYSISELHEHVEVLGPEWNTTLLEEEPAGFLMQYNILKSKKEDTIIRHFAGGQIWRA